METEGLTASAHAWLARLDDYELCMAVPGQSATHSGQCQGLGL